MPPLLSAIILQESETRNPFAARLRLFSCKFRATSDWPRCHCEYPMPPCGMCKHRNCDCHCEEAAADEAIPKCASTPDRDVGIASSAAASSQ